MLQLTEQTDCMCSPAISLSPTSRTRAQAQTPEHQSSMKGREGGREGWPYSRKATKIIHKTRTCRKYIGASRNAFLCTGTASMNVCLAADAPGFPPVSRKITPPPPCLSLLAFFWRCLALASPPSAALDWLVVTGDGAAAIRRRQDLNRSISRHTSSSHACFCVCRIFYFNRSGLNILYVSCDFITDLYYIYSYE